jgi:DNA-directed RNA polymerase subunit H (RpoH/RPB5)
VNQPNVPLVQLFEIRHLQMQYGRHVKVPKHRIVATTELEEILKATNAKTPSVFRKIDSQDPMAKWTGARPGDVLEVTGMCETSVENKRYLFCMADVTNG